MTVRFRSVGTCKSDAAIYSSDLPKIHREKGGTGEKGQSVNIKRILNVQNASDISTLFCEIVRCNSNYASYSRIILDINDRFYIRCGMASLSKIELLEF